MAVHILMTGPVRPSCDSLLGVIESLRYQFPTSVISLLTWTTPHSLRLRDVVDHFFETSEPEDREISRQISARTIQQRQLGLPEGTKHSLYKMMYGVQCICQAVAPYVRDDDIVLRIRTDSMLLIEPDYVTQLMSQAPTFYISRYGDGFDWFGLTTFQTLKQVWCFSSLSDYSEHVFRSWNPEELVRRRIHVPIIYFDQSRTEYYLLRENGRKHYFP